jgi:hypothetical protein
MSGVPPSLRQFPRPLGEEGGAHARGEGARGVLHRQESGGRPHWKIVEDRWADAVYKRVANVDHSYVQQNC